MNRSHKHARAFCIISVWVKRISTIHTQQYIHDPRCSTSICMATSALTLRVPTIQPTCNASCALSRFRTCTEMQDGPTPTRANTRSSLGLGENKCLQDGRSTKPRGDVAQSARSRINFCGNCCFDMNHQHRNQKNYSTAQVTAQYDGSGSYCAVPRSRKACFHWLSSMHPLYD